METKLKTECFSFTKRVTCLFLLCLGFFFQSSALQAGQPGHGAAPPERGAQELFRLLIGGVQPPAKERRLSLWMPPEPDLLASAEYTILGCWRLGFFFALVAPDGKRGEGSILLDFFGTRVLVLDEEKQVVGWETGELREDQRDVRCGALGQLFFDFLECRINRGQYAEGFGG